jgi:hypothetical protein
MSSKLEVLNLAMDKIRNELNVKKEISKLQNSLGIKFPHQLMGKKYQDWLDSFTSEETDEIAVKLQSISPGFYSVTPMICRGASVCPHGHVCPFVPKEPISHSCPVEQQIILDRMSSLMEEYQIDGHRNSDFMLLNRLIELELTDFRASSTLSSPEYQSLLVEQTMGSTPQGELIHNQVLNPLLELKERISREKMKLLGVLVGTPQEKYKKQAALKEARTEEYGNKIAGMNKSLMDIEKKLLEAQKKLEIKGVDKVE